MYQQNNVTMTNFENKPKQIQKHEMKVNKYISSLSGSYAFSFKMYNSPKYNRLQEQWIDLCEKHNYTPNYNFADICS